MNIAVVGAGISGLSLAHYLSEAFPALTQSGSNSSIDIYEDRSYCGGHTRTVQVHEKEQFVGVDMGFIVFNNRTYPNFCRLLEKLQVEIQNTRMSFSVSCESSGLEYRGMDLNGLFAQRRNLLRPGFLRMLADWQRFNRIASRYLSANDSGHTVDEFFAKYRFGKTFRDQYFYPMGSAVWSTPTKGFGKFPIRFIMEFFSNHGLLGFDLPQWHVVRGGSKSYIKPLTRKFVSRIRLGHKVLSVDRLEGGVEVIFQNSTHGDQETDSRIYDHVIFACHSDQARRILGNSCSSLQSKTLEQFRYEKNSVTLHTDQRLMPKNKRAWACWNYLRSANESKKATLTYNMNMLQSLQTEKTYLVTLNRDEEIDPNKVIDNIAFSHPLFGLGHRQAQANHAQINDRQVSFCGAYWGNGFHEDGVNSALAVFNHLKPLIADAKLHIRRLGSASAI